MGSHEVELYVYDLSYGIAKYLSPFIVGKQVEGVWHTSIVVYGHEYSYGKDGISIVEEPEQPHDKIHLGYTGIPKFAADRYVAQLEKMSFTVEHYDLFTNNCHHFANAMCNFLCDEDIPEEYTKLPEKVFGRNVKAGIRRAVVRGGLFVSGSLASSSVAGPQVLLPLFGSLASSGARSSSGQRAINSSQRN